MGTIQIDTEKITEKEINAYIALLETLLPEDTTEYSDEEETDETDDDNIIDTEDDMDDDTDKEVEEDVEDEIEALPEPKVKKATKKVETKSRRITEEDLEDLELDDDLE